MHHQNNALRALVNHPIFIVIKADKNTMGVTIWLRHLFIQQVLSEHLNNKEYYDNITSEIGDYKNWLKSQWSSEEKYGWDCIAPFRATAKVHKDPVMLRPVIAKCGTVTEAVSKWLDVKLQKKMQRRWTGVSKTLIPSDKKLLTWCCLQMQELPPLTPSDVQ
eukprot:scaffold154769_cov36-Cyclotella_meneghiniana.AAC.1